MKSYIKGRWGDILRAERVSKNEIEQGGEKQVMQELNLSSCQILVHLTRSVDHGMGQQRMQAQFKFSVILRQRDMRGR